ncbi:hypothetical protein MUG78_18020 [Gordonia alkaliphila]|uniref:hypothetical protein n=1 Tax=Gordonia alkaliphila TaxID=1053547 RepID=UPI001FF1FE9E|nr:hypothetical protein [Gordonia alkaliphila]MCK0441298.1 hypothetical protein [Gordonia alkaliphila]
MININQYWDKPLADLFGLDRLQLDDVGMDDPRAYIVTADTDRDYHEIIFCESLAFANECKHIAEKDLVDGWLTASALDRAKAAIKAILAAETSISAEVLDTIEIEDGGVGDEPGFEVSLSLPVNSSLTFGLAHDVVIWPFWATMINICDPGTFNSPYLWNRI